jgi:ribosomal protein S18 acetylase RimI-like enzyme
MTDWAIVISDTASPTDVRLLREALYEFNYAMTGYRDGRSLSCYLHDTGTLAAGIDGFTWGGYAQIQYLWVSEKHRGRGLGGQLLAAAEDEARRRGCSTVVLDTHSFQAPDFYRRRGYREVGTTTDTPRGFTQTLFQKSI